MPPSEGTLTDHIITALSEAGGVATFEALHGHVCELRGLSIPSRLFRRFLQQHPERFRGNAMDIWTALDLAEPAGLEEPEEAEQVEPSWVAPPPLDEYCVFDLETTGVDTRVCEIIQIAAVRVTHGQSATPFVSFVRPQGALRPEITELTGIRPEDLAAAPSPREALTGFLQYVGDRLLIAHNADAFDAPVLLRALAEAELDAPELPFIDTLPLARALIPAALITDHRLPTLATYFGHPSPQTHRADADAVALVRVVEGLRGVLKGDVIGRLCGALLARAEHPFARLVGVRPPSEDEMSVLPELLVANLTPPLPERPPRADVDLTHEAVDRAFDRLRDLGWSDRPSQRRFAHAVTEALLEEQVLLCEAATGTGKSAGYLVPSLLAARSGLGRVVVATFTKVLQDQLVESEGPKLSGLLQDKPRLAVLKGMGNYIWVEGLLHEVRDALRDEDGSHGRALCLCALLRSACVSADGTVETGRGALRLLGEAADDPADFYGTLEQCLVHEAVAKSLGPTEFYRRARDNAERSDVVVINHALLLRMLLASSLEGAPKPLSDYLVIDEAHDLENAATAAFSEAVSEKALSRRLALLSGTTRRSLYRLALACGELSREARAAVRLLRQSVAAPQAVLGDLGHWVREFVDYKRAPSPAELERYGAKAAFDAATRGSRAHVELRRATKMLAEKLEELAANLTAFADVAPKEGWPAARLRRAVQYALDDLREVVHTLQRFRERTSPSMNVLPIVELSSGPEEERTWELTVSPVEVAPGLVKHVYEKMRAVTLCSATLTTSGGTFDFMAGRLGVTSLDDDRVESLTLPPAFDYRRNALLCLPDHLPTPRANRLEAEWPQLVSAEMERLIPFVGGGVLGLFTAKVRRDRVYAALSHSPMILQGGYSILHEEQDGALAQFTSLHQSCLMGGPRMWQGIDVPGPSLQCIVMSKLPFPLLLDPLEQARADAVAERRQRSFDDYILHRMVMQLKQGFGRLIRTSEDRGVVVLLDKRLRWAIYRPEAIRALPGPTISYASDRAMYDEIGQFMGLDRTGDDVAPLTDVRDEVLQQFRIEVPMPATEVPLAIEKACEAARDIFAIDELRDFQIEALAHVFQGHDVLALAPTGSGKSLTFQLPALMRDGLTLVISPLIALMRDQVEKLQDDVGLSCVDAITHETPVVAQEEALRRAAKGELRLLYVSPERLQSPKFRALLRDAPLRQVVVDEAHCVSSWGHDFRPDYLRISSWLGEFGDVPIQAVTATATERVEKDIRDHLHLGGRRDLHVIKTGTARPNLRYLVVELRNEGEAMALARDFSLRMEGKPGIIYTPTQLKAEDMAGWLRQANIRAAHYHGGMEVGRQSVEQRFLTGALDCIAATNAFGMGVDKPDVRYIIHLGPPLSVEAYVQETGRAGRDGQPAWCILLTWPGCEKTPRYLIGDLEKKQDSLVTVAQHVFGCRSPGVARALGDGTLLLDVASLDHTLGSRQKEANTCIHYLARAGALELLGDLDVSASVVLNRPPDILVSALPADNQQTMRRLCDRLTFSLDSSTIVNVHDVPALDPRDIGRALEEAARMDLLLYRPFARQMMVRPTGRGVPQQAIEELTAVHSQKERALGYMLEYARLRQGECRAVYLRKHLSGGAEDDARCDVCDLCAPDASLPFEVRPGEARGGRRPALRMSSWILEALSECPGRIGAQKLAAHLMGWDHTFYKGRKSPLPPDMKRLEFHRAFAGRADDRDVLRIIGELQTEGYIETVDKGGYPVLTLSEAGWAVIRGEAHPPD